MKKSVLYVPTVFILITLIFSLTPGCNQTGDQKEAADKAIALIEITGNTMGTTYSVKVVPPGQTALDPENNIQTNLKTGIDALLRTVNQQMSTYIKESEISRFNAYQGDQWFDVSPDTVIVFNEAMRVSSLSGGAFDITVGPLIDLWGFGATFRERKIPPDQEIQKRMAAIGYQKLSIRQDPPALKKEIPQLYCSLSAIAKGFGVDKVAQYLEEQGHPDYMVEIGGEIRTGGTKPGNKPWRFAIATPDGTSRYQKIIQLKDISMATSGDYHNYFEQDGVRYSHTIDPTTGRPITHNLASVTVLHPSCMTADAIATAIDVMGPDKGYRLALQQNLPVFLITREKGKFIEKMTPAFTERLGSGK